MNQVRNKINPPGGQPARTAQNCRSPQSNTAAVVDDLVGGPTVGPLDPDAPAVCAVIAVIAVVTARRQTQENGEGDNDEA